MTDPMQGVARLSAPVTKLTEELTFAVFPELRTHPYLELFHAALGTLGIARHAGRWPSTDAELAAAAPSIHGLHFHWPEYIWQIDRHGEPRRWRTQAGLWKYLRLARHLGLRIVWTLHNLRPHEFHLSDRTGQRLLASFADLVICHSHDSQREFAARFPHAAGRTVVMPQGNVVGAFPPPADRRAARQAFGLPEGARVLAAIGLIRPYKGLLLAWRAVERLGGQYHFVAAGGVLDQASWDELATAVGSSQRALLLPGHLTAQQVADLHAAADCILLPYLRITTSQALLTALTFGRGVVCSDLPYFHEVLGDESWCAEFATPGDAVSIAAAIERFFARKAGCEPQARALAEQFAWPALVGPVAERIRALYL